MADASTAGAAALGRGDWSAARDAFGDAPSSPETLTGLSDALWWMGEIDEALAARQRAYAAHRRGGDLEGAAEVATWLSIETALAAGDMPASNGWFTIAAGLVGDGAPGARGRLELARALRSERPQAKQAAAGVALSAALASGDLGLEARARAAVGHALVSLGHVADGIEQLDAAMVTAVTVDDLRVVGDVACSIMSSGELLGTLDRFERWSDVINRSIGRLGHPALMSFCGACCGELFAMTGRWDEAEAELTRSIAALEQSGHRSRCVHPAVRLAALDIRRGRLEAAEAALAPYRDLPEAASPLAALHLATGRYEEARNVSERRVAQLGTAHLAAVSHLSTLCKARLALGDVEGAAGAASSISAMADVSGLEWVRGAAASCLGLVAGAERRDAEAVVLLEQAWRSFEAAGSTHDAATTRALLGEALVSSDASAAVAHMRRAHEELERLGAARDADRLAARLRSLGERSATGRRGLGLLTPRERQVLELVALGLRNAAIAERLFISDKTAANHVSNILTKLGVSSRTEAARAAAEALSSARR
ncbi:MAG TPA: LuxR C-terminal-related transcriptional regulator [Acidimicrobiia bacterium]|jgi:DNA-binding CsgD family transcriptional regulator